MAFLEYTPTQTLFQYCSREAFLGIASSKQLWFSDLASANDPRELSLGFGRFMAALSSIRSNEFAGVRGIRLAQLESRLLPYFRNVDVFCCCFSMARDALPMWSQYGGSYGGVAIGFRPTAIKSIPARVQKVRYVSGDTDQNYRDLTMDIAIEFEKAGDALSLEQLLPAVVSAFSSFTSLKHSSWAYEREVRMIHNQTRIPPEPGWQSIFHYTGLMPDGAPLRWTEPLRRDRGGNEIKYLSFPFGHLEVAREIWTVRISGVSA